jgi:AcrR family transcriptional regulator
MPSATPKKPSLMVPPPSREEVILDAAAALFRKQGFAGTGLRDVAAKAGMLLGSLQYRFPTKESLLVTLMERAIERVTRAVRAAAEGAGDPLDRLRLGLGAHLDVLLSGDDAVYVLLYDWRVLRGSARQRLIRLRDRYEALWDGLAHEAAGAGKLRPGIDLKLLRLFGFGAVNWVATWYRRDGPLSTREIADAFFAMMMYGALADEARGGKPATASRRRAKRRNPGK